ncbi:MAG: hypothetical protein HY590_03460 [Candidatus Omnitrophica bacterium]|nr:hypothetical protein [Candidatus Omnitrophota bacterium]
MLGQAVYLLLVLVVAKLTILSWLTPHFVDRWTARYYTWVLRLLGFKITIEKSGNGLRLWNRFAGPPVLVLLLLLWKKVFR